MNAKQWKNLTDEERQAFVEADYRLHSPAEMLFGKPEPILTRSEPTLQRKLRKSKPLKRKPLSLKIRFQVMKRDNFLCQLCGANAHIGGGLEVDHKTPVFEGGGNKLENLWTLCFKCNRGKGIETC